MEGSNRGERLGLGQAGGSGSDGGQMEGRGRTGLNGIEWDWMGAKRGIGVGWGRMGVEWD